MITLPVNVVTSRRCAGIPQSVSIAGSMACVHTGSKTESLNGIATNTSFRITGRQKVSKKSLGFMGARSLSGDRLRVESAYQITGRPDTTPLRAQQHTLAARSRVGVSRPRMR